MNKPAMCNNNLLDKEFISFLKPLHIICSFLLLPKISFSGDKVYSINRKYIIYYIIGISITYGLLISTLTSIVEFYEDIAIFYVYITAYSQYSINYTLVCIFNFFHSDVYVKLLLKLQAIEINLYDCKDTKKMRILVRFTCFLLLAIYILFVTLKLIYDPLWDWVRGAFIFTALIFDIELSYCICVAYFLVCKVERWCKIMAIDPKKITLQDEVGLIFMETMCKVYEDILDALEFLKKTSQFTILLHFVIVFVQSITYIEILILMTQNRNIEPGSVKSHAYGVTLWISKAVVTESTLCLVCEILYRRIASAQTVVISYTCNYNSQRARRFLKNIRRLNRVKFRRINVCGIFTVDAALPLRLGRLIADYTVILLQFAFLKN
ncbi:uncharacterized protein [Battus philenor]|uniref:uncharacterized protein n=1 Tax=Battus philenor TaxID=42288 RepID=UPI0035D10C7B